MHNVLFFPYSVISAGLQPPRTQIIVGAASGIPSPIPRAQLKCSLQNTPAGPCPCSVPSQGFLTSLIMKSKLTQDYNTLRANATCPSHLISDSMALSHCLCSHLELHSGLFVTVTAQKDQISTFPTYNPKTLSIVCLSQPYQQPAFCCLLLCFVC